MIFLSPSFSKMVTFTKNISSTFLILFIQYILFLELF